MAILFNPACGACGCTAGNDIFVAGTYSQIGGLSRLGFARVTQVPEPTAFVANVGPTDPGGLKVIYDSANHLLYIAGEFTSINGTARNGIARVNPTTGIVDSFNPNPNTDSVFDMVLHNGLIYFVGTFTTVGGIARNHAACVDTSGTLQAWNPNLNSDAVSIAAGGTVLYLAGDFTTVGGVTRNYAAAVSEAGVLQAWNPNLYAAVLPNGQAVFVASSGLIYVGGFFQKVGGVAGTARLNAACFNAAGVLQAWNPSPNAEPLEFAERANGNLVLVGVFTSVGGFARGYGAEVTAAGALTAFDPELDDDALAVLVDSNDVVYIGGRFMLAQGAVRPSLASFDAGGSLTSWNPVTDVNVFGLAEAV